jgi:hypothetical protein
MADTEYFGRFGEFIHRYASVERIVHYIFRHYSTLPEKVARTIDGGMALSSLISLVKRMAVAADISEPERSELETLFDHLGHITLLRDTLIHRGGENVGQDVISTNLHVAKSEIDLEILTLNLDDIKGAALDCGQMYMRFARLLSPDSDWADDPAAQEWLRQPWRYIPRQPRKPNQRPRASARSQKRQPRASRGSQKKQKR